MKVLILLIIALLKESFGEDPPGKLTDLKKCRVSFKGLEYLGDVSHTESKIRCQAWSSNVPHVIMSDVTDDKFPERSREKAKNYCRNPTQRSDGPWCYTMSDDLLNETCAIPLCSFSRCKITGFGLEFTGNMFSSSSGTICHEFD